MPEDLQLNLEEVSIPSRKDLHGVTIWVLSAGGRLRIQSKPQGEDIDDVLDETVPAGKSWRIKLSVEIMETDT